MTVAAVKRRMVAVSLAVFAWLRTLGGVRLELWQFWGVHVEVPLHLIHSQKHLNVALCDRVSGSRLFSVDAQAAQPLQLSNYSV